MLVARAAELKIPYFPPRILTPGGLSQFLLDTGPAASSIASRLAWAEALSACDDEACRILFPHTECDAPLRSRLAFATTIQHAHSELAAALLRFGQLPDRAGRALIEPERWQALASIESTYQSIVAARSLADADIARTDLLQAGAPPEHDTEVILIGIAELSPAARAALAAAQRIHPLIFAPESLRDRFDDYGCVKVDQWQSLASALRDDQILFADGPGDQAERALTAIAEAGPLTPDQIVIGVPDPEVVPFLERLADKAGGLTLRNAGGAPVRTSAPWRLLAAIAALLESSTFDDLRSLLRHPDIESWLIAESDGLLAPDWLDQIDCYAAASLHHTIDLGAQEPAWHTENPQELALLGNIHRALASLLQPLLAPPRPAHEWAAPLLQTLERIYTAREVDPDSPAGRALLSACRAIRDTIQQLRALPPSPERPWPALDAPTALHLIMQECAEEAIPEEPDAESIEMLGWLELPLDPSEVTIITGLNEGRIPASFGADPLLPDSLRSAAGLPCSRSRFARDAYILSAIAASRPHAIFIAGRRTAADDPLWPSRLLLQSQALPSRIARFLGESAEEPRPRLALRIAPGDTSRFPLAPLRPAAPVQSMSVTSFRTYLQSPYLFYLKHVLRLDEQGDAGRELDPLSFGNLIHLVLERFGASDARHSPREELIRQCLHDELSDILRHRHGQSLTAPLRIQSEIARRRLNAFAQWQAQRVRDGWLIYKPPEWRPSPGRGLLHVDGTPLRLRGRIDRIERNEHDGRLAILDIKTGDKPVQPDKAHRTRSGWVDLQLPLYLHLAEELGADDRTVLGYIAIPRRREELGLNPAGWTPEDLRDADATAANIVRAVREGKFQEVGDLRLEPGAFASLCGTDFVGETETAEADE